MIYTYSHFEIDTESFSIRYEGASVVVEPRVFDLVVHLIAHRDRVIAEAELLSTMWPAATVSASALTRCVCLARKALLPTQPIQTVHTRGYRWVAPVSCAGRARRNVVDTVVETRFRRALIARY
jgi:DNA-binding winged helix-turn-helix (wHTH) protein